MVKLALWSRSTTGLVVAFLCGAACSGSDVNIDEPVDEGNGGASPSPPSGSSGGRSNASGGQEGSGGRRSPPPPAQGGAGGQSSADCKEFFAEENPIHFVDELGPTSVQQIRIVLREDAPPLAEGAVLWLMTSACSLDPYGGDELYLSDVAWKEEISLVREGNELVATLPSSFSTESRFVDSLIVHAETSSGQPVVANFANKNNWKRSEQESCEAWNEGEFDTTDWCIEPGEPTLPGNREVVESDIGYECNESGDGCGRFIDLWFDEESTENELVTSIAEAPASVLTDARAYLFLCDCSAENHCESGSQRVEIVTGYFTEQTNAQNVIYHRLRFPVQSGLSALSHAVVHLGVNCGETSEYLVVNPGQMRCGGLSPRNSVCLTEQPASGRQLF